MSKKRYCFILLMLGIAPVTHSQLSLGTVPAHSVKSLLEDDTEAHTYVKYGDYAPSDVIWTEDFSNEGIGWLIGGPSPLWRITTNPPKGYYSQNTNAFGAETAHNGYLIFDGDSANSIFDSLGNPIAPDTALVYYSGSITSPVVDLSGDSAVLLTFTAQMRHCCDSNFTATVDVSTDGFLSVDTTFPLNAPRDANATLYKHFVFTISQAIASSPATTQIRFNWGDSTASSSHYYVMIDDIKFVKQAPHDLILQETHLGMGALGLDYYYIPISFFNLPGTLPITHRAKVLNTGTQMQTNVVLQTDFPAYSSQSVPTNSLLPNDTTWITDTINFPFMFLIDEVKTNLQADSSLHNTGNDSIHKNVYIDGNGSGGLGGFFGEWFMRDNNMITQTFQGWENNSGRATIGNVFEILSDDSIYMVGADVGIHPASSASSPLLIYAEKFDFVSGTWDSLQLGIVYASSHSSGTLVTTRFSNRIKLFPGDVIAIHAGTYDQANDPIFIQMAQPTTSGSVVGRNSGSDMLHLISPYAPLVRPLFSNLTSIEELKVNANLLQNFPNPATHSTTIPYTLSSAAQVQFELTNSLGQLVLVKNEGIKPEGNHQIKLHTEQLAPGHYFYSLLVNNHRLTKKMVVVK